ncbi:MAG: alanine racemase [bacterium]|nr:alanine racemase [bacterium]
MTITKPTLVVDKKKALKNIEKIKEKIARTKNSVRFRPHFKTHQSAAVGELFREQGIDTITVSSVEMASYFAANGWTSITIAVLVNRHEMESINRLAGALHLELLLDSVETALFLEKNLKHNVDVWIKIDTGYHRTGVEWNKKEEAADIAKAVNTCSKMRLKGLLTHSGHAYSASSPADLKAIYRDTITKMSRLQKYLAEEGFSACEISVGDTPTCSVVGRFEGADEIRCGNFIYYDLMQKALGACVEKEIAAAVACPVIGKYPNRNHLVVYGGAVHLSKEFIVDGEGYKMYGLPALAKKTGTGWKEVAKNSYVASLSQEHGVINADDSLLEQVNVGDILYILPVHSCLTANLLRDRTLVK